MYFPGITTESATVICDDEVETLPIGSHWTTMYLTTHEDEMNMDMGGFILENWEVFGDEYFAKKEWIKSDADLGVTEAGTFKLYHKPE